MEAVKEEKTLTREQRRMRDRINEDANSTFVKLAESYRQTFMDNDPESEIVLNKKRELNAKWRVYCKNRNLIPEAFTQITDFANSLLAEYKAELNPESDDTVQI